MILLLHFLLYELQQMVLFFEEKDIAFLPKLLDSRLMLKFLNYFLLFSLAPEYFDVGVAGDLATFIIG